MEKYEINAKSIFRFKSNMEEILLDTFIKMIRDIIF